MGRPRGLRTMMLNCPLRPGSRPVSALAGGVVLLCLLVFGCRSAPPKGDTAARGIDPRHVPALRTLRAAVEAGDDALATRMLRSLRARPHGAAEQAVLDSFGRVLRGRALAAQLALRLEPAEVEGSRDSRLVLVIAAPLGVEATLHLAPADLLRHVRVVSPDGTETLSGHRSVVRFPERLELVPGGEVRVPVAALPSVDPAPALAVRRSWELVSRAGEASVGGEVLPLASLPDVVYRDVTRTSVLRTAGDTTPEELARAVSSILDGAGPTGPELLELAVRLPERRRDEGLSALAEVLADRRLRFEEERSESALEAGETLEPALRWLTEAREPGSRLVLWERWFREWRDRRLDEEGPGTDAGLDLPAHLAVVGAGR